MDELSEDLVSHIPDFELPQEESPPIRSYGEEQLAKFESVLTVFMWVLMLLAIVALLMRILSYTIREVVQHKKVKRAKKLNSKSKSTSVACQQRRMSHKF
jgi:hypothetical protein